MSSVIVFISLLLSFILIIIFLSFLIKRERKQLSGKKGEEKVSSFLNKIKEKDEVVIDNYIASRNKMQTYSIQIDHIFISHKGVFVIETKDYHGLVSGYRFSTNWSQVLGRRKNKIYNPL